MTSKIKHVANKEEFQKIVEMAGNSGLLILVDFYANWCGPCKLIAPKLEELAAEFKDRILILKVNVDECEELTNEFDVCAMPTFLFIKNKKEICRFSGANYEKLREIVTNNQ